MGIHLVLINPPEKRRLMPFQIMIDNCSSVARLYPAVIDFLITDHNPVFLQIIFPEEKKLSQRYIKIRKNIDYVQFKNLLNNENWS